MASQPGRTSFDVTAEPLQVQLEAFLDEHRAALRGCLDGLTEEQARRRLVPSQTTLLGLVKHAAYAEQVWFGEAVTGRSRAEMGLLREFAQHCGHADILREQILSARYTIRLATADDAGFLGDMLVEAVNWSAQWRPKSREHILTAADTAHYVAGWPRDTDLGVIAEADGQPVGAAWIRFLPQTDPGYGFVAADVPELTIGVAAGWRGRGVGRSLLRALASQARARGIGRISLSVERKNHAQRLYLTEGFRIVDSSDAQSDTMVKDLG